MGCGTPLEAHGHFSDAQGGPSLTEAEGDYAETGAGEESEWWAGEGAGAGSSEG